MEKWLSKYEQGGLVLKQKTKDNYGKKENANEGYSTAGPGWVGEGTTNRGFDYNGAWGGQFQNGGFLQPTSYKLPSAANEGAMSTEKATSIGGGPGEPAFLIPTFKYGKPLKDPEAEYRKTGEHLGGPFKTWQEAEKFGELRHQYVEQGRNIPSPLKWWGDMAMGGSLPGAVGFTYARTQDPAPSNGPYAKKTKASAQNGTGIPSVDPSSLLPSTSLPPQFPQLPQPALPPPRNLYPNSPDPAFRDILEGDVTPIYRQDFPAVQKQIGDYMMSDTYLNRLTNYVPDKSQAKRIAQARTNSLLNVKLLDKPSQSAYYPGKHVISLLPIDSSDAFAHEMGHSIFKSQLSDTRGGGGALGLNDKERAAVLQGLDRPNIYKMYGGKERQGRPAAYFDEHYDTQGGYRERDAVNETYGDLTAIRKILNDKGITNKFGDDITPEMWKKALENEKVIKSPAIKRMRIKYKDDDIIRINNTVAQNDNKDLVPIAQDGTVINPNNIIPKGVPLTVTKNLSNKYDPLTDKWSGVNPKDIEKRLTVIPLAQKAALDAKSMSKKEFKEKYKDNEFISNADYDMYKDEDPEMYKPLIQRIKNEQSEYNNWLNQKQQYVNDRKAKEDFINQYSAIKERSDKYANQMRDIYGYTPGEDTTAHKVIVDKMLNEANQAIDTGIGYFNPQDIASHPTSILGVSEIASNAGVKFIPQTDSAFVENDNYKKAGYRKLLPNETPEAGDISQYIRSGRIGDTELVLGRTPGGQIIAYNNANQTKDSAPGAGRSTRGLKKGSNEVEGFDNTNYYRLEREAEDKIEAADPEYVKKLKGKKDFEASDDYGVWNENQKYLQPNQPTYNQYKEYLAKFPKRQNGGEMSFYQQGLDFTPKTISKNGSVINSNGEQTAQFGMELMPYISQAAVAVKDAIPTMDEIKTKATDVIKNSPKLRKAINSGISYVANTDWGKEKIQNFARNIDPHGYGSGYLRDMTDRSPFDRVYSAAILNKKEESRKLVDSLLATGQADPGDSLRVDLINQYAGLPQKYNTVKPSAYKPTMGNKNEKYYSSPIIERQLLSDIDLVAGNVNVKPVFKTKQDLQNFVQKHFGGEKGKGNNYVTPIEGLGTATTGVGEDEKGHYLSYYDNWDLNPYHGNFADSDNSFEATNDKLGRAILGNEKENIATKKIGTPTQVYGRIYFDKKTGKPKMKKGGVIKDDMGQWAHPGEVTEIGSNNITMKGVDYPVLGISDTGDKKMMQPGKDYKFKGSKVTEYPKGGWLNKYK